MALRVAKLEEQQPEPISVSRARLKALIEQRNDIEDRMRDLVEAASKLSEAQQDETAATTALAALDASEESAIAEWARSCGGAQPIFDTAERDRLDRAVTQAAVKADAARRAEPALTAEYQREAQALARIEPEFDRVIAEIIAEEVAPRITELEAAGRELASKAASLSIASDLIRSMGERHRHDDSARSILQLLEAQNNRLHAAAAKPSPEHERRPQHLERWSRFAARLRNDPVAKLEG